MCAVAGLAACPPASAAGESVVGTQPHRNELVYVGPSTTMPTDSSYLIAIAPGKLTKPRNVDDAARTVADALPAWMRAAIRQSHDDHECVVLVNDVDYFAIVTDWFVEEWMARFSQQSIVDAIDARAEDVASIKATLQQSTCAMLKQ